jgi:hypothetical protein
MPEEKSVNFVLQLHSDGYNDFILNRVYLPDSLTFSLPLALALALLFFLPSVSPLLSPLTKEINLFA